MILPFSNASGVKSTLRHFQHFFEQVSFLPVFTAFKGGVYWQNNYERPSIQKYILET
jgi:hypothetical protein